MKNEAAQQLGKLGGAKRSEAKTAAARKNAAKPRGRWVSAVLFEYTDSYENRNQTVTLVRGKGPSNYDDHYAWMVGKIKEQYPHAQEIEYVQSMTEKI